MLSEAIAMRPVTSWKYTRRSLPPNQQHCNLQDFYNVVFDNKDTLQEYHRLEGDPAASISPWSGDARIICFSVPLSGVPDVVKRAIGLVFHHIHKRDPTTCNPSICQSHSTLMPARAYA